MDASTSKNLADLRRASLKLIGIIPAAIAHLWLMILLWPETGSGAGWAAWLGGGTLATSVVISYALRERSLRLASGALVAGLVGAVGCALVAFESAGIAYLFTLPVCVSSMFLAPIAILTTALVSICAVAATHLMMFHLPFLSQDLLLPVAVVTAVALVAWLSQRNLMTALAWAWQGYERAREKEEVAINRGAELRQALKALDEATHRLERTGQMLTFAREQAEEARRLKQQFAQTISHELRTPLSLIVSFTELMTESPEYYGEVLPSSYLRDLSTVHRNACHLQGLVNDVLDLARIEAAEMGLVLSEVSPDGLVLEAVNTARSLVESNGLALHVQLEPHLPALRADPLRIRQVLYNLLSNAVRFTEAGSITIRACREAADIVFSVEDTGVGIAPDDISKVFREFQQLDGSTRRRHGGAGLGLAICRSFVELHGGRIWATSQVGVGSAFFFSLPVASEGLASHEVSPPGRTQRMEAGRRDGECILLAVTRSMRAVGLLTRHVRGIRTVAVQSIERAREMASELLPQAVLVDVASVPLPQGQLGAMVQEWSLPNTPFIACPLPGEEPWRRNFAVDGYIIKPLSRTALWDLLRPLGEDVDRVLVIDDDRDFVRLLSRLLDNPVRRYEVASAHSGYEGLALLDHWHPHLVLLDLGLPDMDGREIVQRMKAEPRWKDTPVIIISGKDEPEKMPLLEGEIVVAKASGMMPGEIVGWLQRIVDTIIQPSREAPG